jgi:16S rRNA (cytosine1402-N4)-methyltransferase
LEFLHIPVLYEESLSGLLCSPGKTMVDGTLGGGGHALGILKRITPGGRLIGLDKDEEALKVASQRLAGFGNAFTAVHADYANIPRVLHELGIGGIDGCLLDLGVSSYQLDNPERGFSYHADAPLDMRMDRSQALNAREVVNEYSKQELVRVLRDYGEERFAGRIADRIVKRRAERPIERTVELAELIKEAIPAAARRTGPHPARRAFQGIRMEVNGELDNLGRALDGIRDALRPGGRLCIITFHSLEDRLIKTVFARWAAPCTCPKDFPQCVCGKTPYGRVVTRRPIVSGAVETDENARARSAKLRVFERM